jgi:hypothetical protein
VADSGGVDSMLPFQLERGGDETEHSQKMKQRQRVHLGSMKTKRDTTWRRGDIGLRRDNTGEWKGRRRYQLG